MVGCGSNIFDHSTHGCGLFVSRKNSKMQIVMPLFKVMRAMEKGII